MKDELKERFRSFPGQRLWVIVALLLCGYAPAGAQKAPASSVNIDETQFARAVVNAVPHGQRSELLRLSAQYPELFIQAGAEQLKHAGLHRR